MGEAKNSFICLIKRVLTRKKILAICTHAEHG